MLYRFGDWEVDSARGEVRCGEHVRRLQPKVLGVLQYLLDRPGQIVPVDDLIADVWGGRTVEPVGVARNIAHIRRALDDDSRQPRYVETIPKRGYRFIGPVTIVEPGSESGPGCESGPGPLKAESSQRNWRWPILGSVLALLLLAAGGWRFTATQDEPVAKSLNTTSIAVLPVMNLSETGEFDYLADGLSVEIIQTLADVPGLRVASSTSSAYFAGSKMDVKEICERLNVDFLVEVSLRGSGDSLRIAAQLTDSEGFETWSDTFDRPRAGILAMQTDLARAIVGSLPLVLADADLADAISHGTTDSRAYDLVMRANFLRSSAGNKPDLAKARALLMDAIEIDPHYYAAYVDLASVMRRLSELPGSVTSREEKFKAIRMLEAIESQDVSRTRPYRAMDRSFQYYNKWDWPSQEAVVREQLLDTAPESYWFANYGWMLLQMGLMDGALAYFRKATELEPMDPSFRHLQGRVYLYSGRYAEAIPKLDECLALAPKQMRCLAYKGFALAQQGEFERAMALLEQTSWNVASVHCVFLLLTNQHCDPGTINDSIPTANATVGMLLGDYDAVFRWIDYSATEDRLSIVMRAWTHTWPKQFHEDPRWKDFLQKVGLTDEWRDELCQRAQTLQPYTGISVECPVGVIVARRR